ncbi:MAG: hypothetical protein ABFC24_05110 [Methanoregulaceae archaeon]
MRGKFAAIFLLALLLVAAASAAEITLSTDQKDYYFVLGETAEIPVTISNTYGHAVAGMLRSSTTESSMQMGILMSSSNSRSQDYTAQEGNSVLTVSAGTSDTEKTLQIQLAFDYTETTPLSASLGEITVHFVTDQSQVQTTKQQVTSTTTAGQSGSSSSSSSSSSSFQFSQQLQQQSATSGSGQDLQNNQMAQDTSALKQQLQQEQARSEEKRSEFLELLNADPTYRAINGTLTNESYPLAGLEPNPVANDTGTFTAEFTGTTGKVAVTGSMENGVVQSVVENTSARIGLPTPLTDNQTYQGFLQDLGNGNYQRTGTLISTTPGSSTINLTYQNAEGRAAWVNGTIQNGNLTSVTLAKEKVEFPFLPVILGGILLALAAGVGYLLYRKYRNRPKKTASQGSASRQVPGPKEYRKEALKILENAERAFSIGQYPEAYGGAGQALRFFISHRFGSGTEMTNREVGTLLHFSRNEISGASDILTRCSLVEFAKDEPEPEEFRRYVDFIRRIIRDT